MQSNPDVSVFEIQKCNKGRIAKQRVNSYSK